MGIVECLSYTFARMDTPLGRWVNDIRNGRKRGNGLRITSEMVSQLEALGFVWDATTKGKWFQPFMEHLTAYKDAFGDCLIRRSYTSSDGYKLGFVSIAHPYSQKNLQGCLTYHS